MHSLEYAISESAAGEGYQQGSHYERPIHRSYLAGRQSQCIPDGCPASWSAKPFLQTLLLGYLTTAISPLGTGSVAPSSQEFSRGLFCNAPLSDAFHSLLIRFKPTYPNVVPPNKGADRETRSTG
jgi:hypothetical protein